jgi:hypothetical protein
MTDDEKDFALLITATIIGSLIIGAASIAFYTFISAKVLTWMGVL